MFLNKINHSIRFLELQNPTNIMNTKNNWTEILSLIKSIDRNPKYYENNKKTQNHVCKQNESESKIFFYMSCIPTKQ